MNRSGRPPHGRPARRYEQRPERGAEFPAARHLARRLAFGAFFRKGLRYRNVINGKFVALHGYLLAQRLEDNPTL